MEAIKGAKTVQQIAAENNLHPVQVTQWKTQMLESARGVFARGRDQSAEQESSEKEKERLERKVGQLVVEVDWLQEKCRELGDRSMRKAIVEREGCALSVRRQCELLAVNRNRLEGPGRSGVGSKDLEMARRIDEIHLRFPEFGTRRTSQYLLREGWEKTSRRTVDRITKAMGLAAIYRRPRTSPPGAGAQRYPYLLRGREVASPDEVWCADVTYIPMARALPISLR